MKLLSAVLNIMIVLKNSESSYLDRFLSDPRLQDFTCVKMSWRLLNDVRLNSAVQAPDENRFVNVSSTIFSDSCLEIMNGKDVSRWMRGENMTFEEEMSQEIQFAIQISSNTVIKIDTESKVSEIWYPLETAMADIDIRTDELGDLDKGFDLFDHLCNADLNLHGQEIRVLYEFFEPYCIVNAETKALEGGIFPEIFNTLAARLNVSVKYENTLFWLLYIIIQNIYYETHPFTYIIQKSQF